MIFLYIPLNLGINLAKIVLVSAWYLKERSQVLETCSQDIRNTFQMQRIKNILIGPFEFVYYLHAIHSVKLTKIVGVESNRCNLVVVLNSGNNVCF